MLAEEDEEMSQGILTSMAPWDFKTDLVTFLEGCDVGLHGKELTLKEAEKQNNQS